MASAERNEIFRGHFEECVRHLIAQLSATAPRGTREATKAKRPIADFCGVKVSAVTRWFKKISPIGEQYLKFLCYLDLLGYRVIEVEKLARQRRFTLELIGYGLMTAKEICRHVGYTNESTLLQILKGVGGVNPDKDERMLALLKTRKEGLEQKKREALRTYNPSAASFLVPETAIVARPVEVQKITPETSARSGKAGLHHIMEGLLLILDDGTCEDLTQEEIDIILRLSAHLSNLSAKLMNQARGLKKGG